MLIRENVLKNILIKDCNDFDFKELSNIPKINLRGSITDKDFIARIISEATIQSVFHLAAQPLVRYSYDNPIETYNTNVIGTLNLLEAIRVYKS